jgi:hypothetical protein
MKIEKWTFGLAAAGLVTLSPGLLAQTQPTQLVPLQTALTATTISGYVDTSAVWNPGTGNANPAPFAFNNGKQDGFNIDSVDIKIAKDLDEGQWSAGYNLELGIGPDAEGYDGGAYPIRQAYIVMRVPVGNGLDLKMGRFDNIIGYESSDAYKDPNWTRSYGYTFEPTEHTGLLASYKFCDFAKADVGVANTVTTFGANTRGYSEMPIESKKAFLSLLTLTAPDSMGFLKGSSLYAGWDYGPGAATHDKSELYLGTTLNTPLDGLTLGASYDAIWHNDVFGYDTSFFSAYAGYLSYKATDKLTLSARGEYATGQGLTLLTEEMNDEPNQLNKVMEITGTVSYDLWANVITRLEIRWDHACNGADAFGGRGVFGYSAPDKKNDIMIAANVIYKF